MTRTPKLLQRTLAACAAAGVAAACTFFAVPALAEEGPPSGFPSWSDVEKTKNDAAATAAQANNISHLLDSLENEAGVLGDAAVQAGAQYAATQQRHDAVTAQVSILNAQAQRADDQARQYTRDAVAVAVQNYKTGGAHLGVLTTMADLETADSLNGVDLMQKIGERSAMKASLARESHAAATHLQKSREAALSAHQEVSQQAAVAREAAIAAQTAVNKQIETQQEQSNTLVAQLAFLKGTTEAQEREYRQGQIALAQYEQVQDAKRAADEAARLTAKQQASTPAPQPLPEVVPTPAPAPKPYPNPVPPPSPPPAPAPAAPQAAPDPIVLAPSAETTPGGSGSLALNLPGGPVNDPAGAKAYAAAALGSYGWGPDQFQCLNNLWERESNWRTNATNPYSGAYGIAQALPASKYGQSGSDWLTDYRTQVNWGLGYIQGRYGSPCGAWDHSQTVGWY